MLTTKTMLVFLNISQPKLSRVDNKATKEVCDAKAAKRGAANVTKVLFDPADYSPITALIGQIRKTHYARTLPWLDSGQRILSSEGFLSYTDEMRGLTSQFDRLTREFCDKYEVNLERSKLMLADLFNEFDYPSVEAVRDRFGINLSYSPVPDAGDFRVEGIEEIETARIKADLVGRQSMAIEAAMKDVADRLKNVVGSIATKLTEKRTTQDVDGCKVEKDAIFRDSLIYNAKELVALLPSLNISGDPAITLVGQQLAKQLEGVEPEALRKKPEAKKDLAKAAQSIFDQMSGLY